MFPAELKYTKSHEYVRVEGNSATLGLTVFAIEQVKDIVYLELPKAGQELKAGTPFGSLESVKAVFELLSPVSGRVTAVNGALNTAPDIISKSPYGDGWLVKLEMSEVGELNKLMSSEDYEKYIKTEGRH